MTTFKKGDFVVPKDKDQLERIMFQRGEAVGSFPWKVAEALGAGDEQYLEFEDEDGNLRGYYAKRFMKTPPPNKSLDDYM
jgi:hypothetical protein